MASLDVLSQFCVDLGTAAQSAGIVSGQITQGHWEQPAPVEGQPVYDLWAQVAKNGFYVFIELPGGHVNFYDKNGRFTLTVKLIGSFPANVSSNLQAMMLQTAKLLDAWATFAEWTSGLNREAIEVSWTKPEMIFHENPYIGITSFSVSGCFVAGQAAAPVLDPPVS